MTRRTLDMGALKLLQFEVYNNTIGYVLLY
jgi:hypothetical protein